MFLLLLSLICCINALDTGTFQKEKMMGNKPREPLGLVVKISSIRKGKNGKTSSRRIVGEGRNGHTGKVAVVKNVAGEVIARYTEPTFAALTTLLRRKYNISPSITIKSKGETRV